MTKNENVIKQLLKYIFIILFIWQCRE